MVTVFVLPAVFCVWAIGAIILGTRTKKRSKRGMPKRIDVAVPTLAPGAAAERAAPDEDLLEKRRQGAGKLTWWLPGRRKPNSPDAGDEQ